MGINAGAQVAIILLACRPCVVIVDYWDKLYLGRAPSTKETLPDFREWCRVTRHPRVFRGLTGYQRTPDFGVSHAHRQFTQFTHFTHYAFILSFLLTTSIKILFILSHQCKD